MLNVLFVALGVLLLTGGGEALIRGSMGAANRMGISPLLSGLLIVGFGTSAPELVVSVDAALSGRPDIAIGNVVGSNIFNVLGILGVSALLQPLPVPERVIHFDQWIMLGTSLLLLVFLYTGNRLNRLEGALLLLGYGAYLGLSFSVFR